MLQTSNKIKIAIISGARPNFMKVVPLRKEFKKQRMRYFLINTGQHFDKKMSADFFEEFGIRPDYTLRPSKTSEVKQLADIMKGLERVFLKENPNLVIVVGDINSTFIGAFVAKKMGIKLAHVEAGLRSYNKKMPEEMNRVLADHMADLLFASMQEGVENLKKEGITKNVFLVGNIMMDTMEMFLPKVKSAKEDFYFCTLHRAENVDDKTVFSEILNALEIISKDSKIYLPLHHRTKKMAKEFGFLDRINNIFEVTPPLSYRESLYFQKNAKLVLTDSGGVQEETSYLGTPCITLRTETERPITIDSGTNTIGGVSKASILKSYKKKDLRKIKTKIPLWDGKTAKRIVEIIKKNFL